MPENPAEELLPHQARVRVRMFADPIVVDKGELPDLSRQGLLADDDTPGTPEPGTTGAAGDAGRAPAGDPAAGDTGGSTEDSGGQAPGTGPGRPAKRRTTTPAG